MRARFFILLCTCAAVLAGGTSAASAHGSSPGKARYLVFPVRASQARLRAESAAGTTIPLWSSTIRSFGRNFNYTMVGTDPVTTNSSDTIPTDVIPIKVTFASDTSHHVFDPTATDPSCGLSTSSDLRTLQSPLFLAKSYHSYGTNIGDVEYEDAFMRENFAKYVLASGATHPNYGIVLSRATHPAYSLTIPAADGGVVNFGGCTGLGEMSISYWDALVQNTILPALVTAGETSPTRMPVLLLYNVIMYDGTPSNCCILGYHSGYQPNAGSGEQYYAVADYDSSGAFTGSDDVSGLSHELGEWINDPNGNNATPAWGHIGQVSGCQSNLEVGDPLSGTTVSVPMPNGVTYHPQELAFLSWFYRTTPSIGIHDWYSSNGTFRSDAGGICS